MSYITLSVVVLLLFASSRCRTSTAATFLSVKHREAYDSPLRLSNSFEFPRLASSPLKEFVQVGLAMMERRRLAKAAAVHGISLELESLTENSPLAYSVANDNHDYLVNMEVGTPAQNLTFLIDTASELIWSKCDNQPCVDPSSCDEDEAPVRRYEPWRSGSAAAVPCVGEGELCYPTRTLHTSRSLEQMCRDVNSTCDYTLVYADGLTARGSIFTDEFEMQQQQQHGTSDGSSNRKRLALGCTRSLTVRVANTGTPGIIGLNNGPYSFISQLLATNSTEELKFAHCFPSTKTAKTTAGTLLFGDYHFPPASLIHNSSTPPSLRYIPFSYPRTTSSWQFYFVDLQGITVGKVPLVPPTPVNASDTSDQRLQGTFFDTGTVLSRLEKRLHDDLVRELTLQTQHLRPFTLPEALLDLCYNISLTEGLPELPTVTLRFRGGAPLELGSADLLFSVDINEEVTTVCLAFVYDEKEGEPAANIIGNYQTRGRWVEYDLERRRIGFIDADCSKSGSTS